MSEIDKSLPNVEQTIKVPNPEEVEVEIAEEQAKNQPVNPVDVQENPDGSVDVNFQPGLVNPGLAPRIFFGQFVITFLPLILKHPHILPVFGTF